MSRRHLSDRWQDDEVLHIVVAIFVIGSLLYSCHPAPHGGPVEHKCWQDTGYEKC